MNEVLKEISIWVAIYTGIIIFTTVAINFFTSGILFKLMRAKASRGKLYLIEVYMKTNTYFRIGRMDDRCLVFKDRDGKVKRLSNVPKEHIQRWMGCWKVEYDYDKGVTIAPDWEHETYTMITAHDPNMVDLLIKKAAIFGQTNLEKLIIITLVLLVITMLAVGYLVYADSQILKIVSKIQPISQAVEGVIVR